MECKRKRHILNICKPSSTFQEKRVETPNVQTVERTCFTEREREIFYVLVHFSDNHSGQHWARMKPGAHLGVPRGWYSPQVRGPPSATFPKPLTKSWDRNQYGIPVWQVMTLLTMPPHWLLTLHFLLLIQVCLLKCLFCMFTNSEEPKETRGTTVGLYMWKGFSKHQDCPKPYPHPGPPREEMNFLLLINSTHRWGVLVQPSFLLRGTEQKLCFIACEWTFWTKMPRHSRCATLELSDQQSGRYSSMPVYF